MEKIYLQERCWRKRTLTEKLGHWDLNLSGGEELLNLSVVWFSQCDLRFSEPVSMCLSLLLIAAIKHHDQKQPGKDKVYLMCVS